MTGTELRSMKTGGPSGSVHDCYTIITHQEKGKDVSSAT